MTEVKAKAPKVNKEAAVTVDLGVDAQDAITRFGDKVVFSNYLANAVIGVQSAIRRYLEKGKTQEEIQAIMNTYKPGVTLERVIDPLSALANQMENKSDEEMEAIFEQLKAKIAAKKAAGETA